MRAVLIVALLLGGAAAARAQDSRPAVEPRFPPTCLVLSAPLRTDTAGPSAGGTPASEDAEAAFETAQLAQALARCPQGQAVELTLGATPADNAFLLNPVTVPAGVSLVIDGGVTVYASRNPQSFQNPAEGRRCATVGQNYPVDGICLPLFTLSSQSGIYGYGVLDGQGHRELIRDGQFSSGAWWDLLDEKKSGCGSSAGGVDADSKPASSCEQASPPMVSAGELTGGQVATDLTLFGITLRNPPFHTTRLGGVGMTVWGVKVQAPWNVPNSDGFDVSGQDILIRDVTVANGDQDIAVTSVAGPGPQTRRVTIEGLTAYGKGGVALLGGASGITDLLVRDMAMTGDVPSFVMAPWQVNGEPTAIINGVDVRTARLRGTDQLLASYGQALPTATNEIQGLQINSDINAKGATEVVFRNITFQDVCLQDVVRPVHVGPLTPFTSSAQVPVVEGVVFRNVHVLRPTDQFPEMAKGIVAPGRSGSYSADFESYPPGQKYNHLTFENVVFDDLASGSTSLAALVAKGNVLVTRRNVYPATLNDWASTTPPVGWTLQGNSYDGRTAVSQPALALPCPAARWSFLLGDLYLSRGARSAGEATNRRHLAVEPWQTVTLNAVVQPAMSQTTWFRADSYGADPGLLAVGAPALTNAVEFREGDRLVALGQLGANGTLATATVGPVAPGLHTYTARYPGDVYYQPFAFGTVTVLVQ